MKNLKGALTCFEEANIKPNYSALGREYGLDRRTAKKMYLGIKNNTTRIKSSKLNQYQELIKAKLSIPGTSKKAVYEFIIMNVDDNVGTYLNFKKYVSKNKDILIPKKIEVHPRFETDYGKQLQFDWKGPITLHTRKGEEIVFYVFSSTLGASRMHTYEISEFMTRETVQMCLIHCFQKLGGVPETILTDNMSSIVNYSEHEFVSEFKAFCKDFGTTPKKCKVRSCQTKGKVENCNKFVSWLLPYDHEFNTMKELQMIMSKINDKINGQINQTTNMPPISLFNIEKEYLRPLPKQDIIAHYTDNMIPTKVSNDSLVYYKGTKYSVSPKYINQTVKLQEIDNKLLIYYNTNLITTHEIAKQKILYHEEHYTECLKYTMPYKEQNDIEKIAKENLKLLNRLTKEKEGSKNEL